MHTVLQVDCLAASDWVPKAPPEYANLHWGLYAGCDKAASVFRSDRLIGSVAMNLLAAYMREVQGPALLGWHVLLYR